MSWHMNSWPSPELQSPMMLRFHAWPDSRRAKRCPTDSAKANELTPHWQAQQLERARRRYEIAEYPLNNLRTHMSPTMLQASGRAASLRQRQVRRLAIWNLPRRRATQADIDIAERS